MGFRLHLNRGGFLVQSPLSSSTTSSWPSSHSCRSRDSFHLARSAPSVLYGEAETLGDAYRTHSDSPSLQHLENYFWRTREAKVALEKGPNDRLHSSLDYGIQMSYNGDELEYLTGLQVTQASHFRLLIKNLDMLEGLCDDSSAVRLERDILEQLKRLGALRLFHSCLSRTTKFSSSFDSFNVPIAAVEEPRVNDSAHIQTEKVIVLSVKKELRRLRRKKTLVKDNDASLQESCSQTISDDHRQPNSASAKRSSRSRNKRQKIARNEAEMSNGFKVVAELEKIRTLLEEETCQVASLSRWAEATGITSKELQQRLDYGWHCRDQLLWSARSLVLFIARNYSGLGIAFEDLIQAGNLGVLQGAERFDQSRGYKFSTYVQYWIRKSMSSLVAKHARGIRIPSTLSKVINQIQRARKALSTSNGKYPDDCEIAKHTVLSMAKIMSASRCLRVVGSIDQNIGDGISIKYTEITPDASIPSPEESITRQHMIKDVYALLQCLEPREKRVLVLRFGLGNFQCKSLDEIGRHFRVSKEWIRKIERAALGKLRDEKSLLILSQYAHLQR